MLGAYGSRGSYSNKTSIHDHNFPTGWNTVSHWIYTFFLKTVSFVPSKWNWLSWVPFTVATWGVPWHLSKQKSEVATSLQLQRAQARALIWNRRTAEEELNHGRKGVSTEQKQALQERNSSFWILASPLLQAVKQGSSHPFPHLTSLLLLQLLQWVTMAGKMAGVKGAYRQCTTTEGCKSPQDGRDVGPQTLLSYFQVPPHASMASAQSQNLFHMHTQREIMIYNVPSISKNW